MENRGPLLTLVEVLRRINEDTDDFASSPAATANDCGEFGDYPLHKAAIWGDIEAARVLLENGADINATGEDGDTPLHRAFAGNHPKMVEFLISRGADVTIRNRYGNLAGNE